MEGKDKRARTLYTDYLTPAAVWAQETEHKVKKSDELRWRRDAKYRLAKRREILAEALKLLPNFERVEDMPVNTKPKETQPFSLSEYVAQREAILLAEQDRIIAKACAGEPVDVDDIDERLAVLSAAHDRITHKLDQAFKSARAVLLGLRATRLTRALNFDDPAEVVAPVDDILARKGYAGVTPNSEEPPPATQPEKGNAGVPLIEMVNSSSKGNAGVPLSAADSAPSGLEQPAEKGNADVPLSTSPDERPEAQKKGNIGIPPTCASEAPPNGENVMLTEALAWAAVGVEVFPAYEAADGTCVCTDGAVCRSLGKHPYWHVDDLPEGKKTATTELGQIKTWWTRWPNANIAARMSGSANLLAIDVDPRSGGSASLSDLSEAHGDEWLQTRCHKTDGGDWHFFFTLPVGVEVHRAKLAPGIDLKHANGYVLMPPSSHVKGCYTVENPAPVTCAPAWLVKELTRLSDAQPSIIIDFQDERDRRGQFGAGARHFSSGERNDGLRDVAFGRWLHGYAVDATDLFRQVREVRDTRCEFILGAPPPTDAQLWDLVRRTTQKFARGELRKE